MDEETKICSKCGEEKQVTEFSRDYRAKDKIKYLAACKECMRAYSRQHTKDNAEHERERKRKWHEAHPEYIKGWQERNREHMREHDRLYYLEHREENNARSRAYRRENAERLKQYGRQYRLEHREECRIVEKHYKQEHKKETRARIDEWRRCNPGKTQEYLARRRALEMGAEGSYTADDWTAILDKYGHKCLACGTTENISVDHVIPLRKGGSNYPHNLQPLCVSCNSSKKNRYIEYRPDKQIWGFT